VKNPKTIRSQVSKAKKMVPPKFRQPSQFARRTHSTNKPLEEMTRVVDVDDIPTIETKILTWIEEENSQEEATKVNQAMQGQKTRMKVNPSTKT